MTQRTAFLSDIHGNSPALQAVLADVQRCGCSRMFVLGDVVAGIDPHGCVTLLQEWADRTGVDMACLKGNAESYLLTPDLDALWDREEPWNADVIRLIRWIEAHLSPDDLAWIRRLPEFLLLDGDCLVHDSPMDRLDPPSWHQPGLELKYQEWFYHSRGISEDMGPAEWQQLLTFMDGHGIRRVFCGHTHLPFMRNIAGRTICNAGSLGAPNHGDPRAVWVLQEELPGQEATLTFRPVAYDVAHIHRLIDAAPDYPDGRIPGFAEAYKKWFSTGIHWKAHLAA